MENKAWNFAIAARVKKTYNYGAAHQLLVNRIIFLMCKYMISECDMARMLIDAVCDLMSAVPEKDVDPNYFKDIDKYAAAHLKDNRDTGLDMVARLAIMLGRRSAKDPNYKDPALSLTEGEKRDILHVAYRAEASKSNQGTPESDRG